MTDLKRTNLEWLRINLNTTSNKLEWITKKMGFFLQLYSKRKKNKPTNYLTRQKTLCNSKNLQYNEMNKTDNATLNKHNP